MKRLKFERHNQALGWIACGLRIGLGCLFVVAGALKLNSPNALAASITGFRLVPAMVVVPLSTFLPLFELGLGFYLIAGLFTQVVAALAFAQCLVFALAIASVVLRGLTVSCGCFGPGDTSPATWLDVIRDLALTVCAVPVIWLPPGRFSLDYYIAKRR